MSVVLSLLVVVWVGLCAAWVGLLFAQAKARRDGLLLTVDHPDAVDPADGHDRSSVCVVIPAKDEARNLPTCLRSVLSQSYPELRVVVVDDRSRDETAAIAAEFAQEQPRLRVERVTELPAGWTGKAHALFLATRSVESDWLLFIDADCTLDPQAVRVAVEEAQRRRVELLTLWPRQAEGGFWEHLTIPLCAGIIALWFDAWRVNDPQSDLAFANGQFLLIKRDAYERIDGHRAVRSAVIEDVPLAEHAKRNGLACFVACGRDLVAVRMYEGYRSIRDGWARIYVGALRSGTKIALSLAWLAFGSLWPFVAAPVLATSIARAHASGIAPGAARLLIAGLCALHLLLIGVVTYRFRGLGGCKRSYLLLYPLSVLVVMRILARAWWWLMVRRSIPWRQTRYAINRKATIVEEK